MLLHLDGLKQFLSVLVALSGHESHALLLIATVSFLGRQVVSSVLLAQLFIYIA